jgi:hypothetical protein
LFVSAELVGIESASGTGAGWSAGFGSHASRARNDVRLQADGSSIRPFSKSLRDFAPRQRLTASSAVMRPQPPTKPSELEHHTRARKFSRIDQHLDCASVSESQTWHWFCGTGSVWHWFCTTQGRAQLSQVKYVPIPLQESLL